MEKLALKPPQPKEEGKDKESKIQISNELTPEQRLELFESGNELVKNIASIWYIRYARYSKVETIFQLDDFISWGTIGLIEASKKFDPSRGNEFLTYADRCIRWSIKENLRNQRKIQNLMSRSHTEFLQDREKAIESLQGRLNREPKEIAEEMGFTMEEYYEKLAKYPIDSGVVNFTTLLNDEDIELYSLLDAIIQERNPYRDISRQEDEEEKLKFLHKFLEQLKLEERKKVSKKKEKKEEAEKRKDRNCNIIDMYFIEGLTNEKIGEMVGLDEAMVSIITTVAKERLRELFKEQGYEVSEGKISFHN